MTELNIDRVILFIAFGVSLSLLGITLALFDDVKNLESSRDISKSNALVKGPRKILHREVRDWIVQPFQNKQNKFNQKTLKNIREIYFEIENSNDKINNVIKKLETQQKKLEMESVMSLAFLEVLERIPTKKEVNNYLKQYKNEKLELDNFRIVLKNSKEFFELQEKKIIFEKYRNEIKKPIFVIGVPRTGTALIQGILCGHKDLAWMSDKDVGNWLSSQEQFQVHNYYKWLIANKKKIPTSDEALFVLGKKLAVNLL